ncbi:MAG: EAL domain-containing protein [Marinobacter sp.]|nr:EAL domain-containing protein [Marinobacter sp.]
MAATLVSLALVFTSLASVVAKGPDFEQVFMEFGIPMLLIEPDSGRIVEANAAAADFYGYPVAAFEQMQIQQINTFTEEQVAEERQLAQQQGRNYFIFRHRLADGEVRTVEVHSRPYEFDGRRLLFSVINDITPGRHESQDLWHYQSRLEGMVDAQVEELERTRLQQIWLLAGVMLAQAVVIGFLVLNIRRRRQLEEERKRANEALRYSADRMAEAQRIAQVGSWELFCVNGRYRLTCSEEMFRILELPPGDYDCYREALLRIHPDDREEVFDAYKQAVQTGTSYEIGHRLEMPDGRVKHVYLRCKAFSEDQNTELKTQGTIQDLTKHQLTQDSLTALASTFAGLQGTDFYHAVSRHLVQALGLDYAFVARVVPDFAQASVLAGWAGKAPIDPFSYSLKGTPCSSVMKHGLLVIPEAAKQAYPDDELLVEMGVESYIGSVLLDKNRQPIGLLVAMSRSPMLQDDLVSVLVQLFVDRVSAEMQRSEAETLIEQADRYRQIVLKFSSRFINLPLHKVDAAVDEAFGEVGAFIGADRCYLFSYDFDQKTMSNSYEWCAPGVSSRIEHLQDRPLREMHDWTEKHELGQPMIIPSVADLPEGYQKQCLQEQSVKSLVNYPLMRGEQCLGFVGVDSVTEESRFGERTVELLRLFADLLVNIEQRRQKESELQRSATTLRQQQKQLERIAHFDPLTGLPNRTLLADRLQQAMAQCLRHDTSIAVVFIDLDGFKAINDTHSHAVGDQLLVKVAKQMKRVMRDEDTLARLGGDEFVAVLLDLKVPEDSIEAIDRLLMAAARPMTLNNLELSVSASIGVSFYPQHESLESDQLIRQADQAMYQAKQAGKNRYYLFDVERERAVRNQHESLERIREALRHEELVLHYQPKVNMRTGEVVGVEALVRWQHPERGLLPPANFLPVIENTVVAIELGNWVMRNALDQLVSWKEAGIRLQVSINIDAIHLQHPDFIDWLTEALNGRSVIEPWDLELEILETTALEDIAQVSKIITACEKIGVGFALDDFGTGYSSLTYLKRLPAQLLKIDRSFVRDMLEDPDDLAILDGVIRLAEAFRRNVIAEGVETQAHCQALLELGCELGQGYAIARPMAANALQSWLDNRSGNG